MERRKTTSICIGGVKIGSDSPVRIQSMTNTDTIDTVATLAQINALAKSGCELVRVAVLNEDAAAALKIICSKSPLPIIADIHFDYRLALKAIDNGVNALRINPGNIGEQERVEVVVKMAKAQEIPIRIGVNSGSIEKEILRKYGKPCAAGLVESAMGHIQMLERLAFYDMKISLKSSNVPMMLEAYRMIAEKTPYPLHLGVTEAGSINQGVVKSAIGIGALLSEGIGDTIRVSLTGDPLQEMPVAKQILQALNLRDQGVEVIACPTCGRTKIDLLPLVMAVEELTKDILFPLKIAVMGCVVNGPGEAREADLGIAGGDGKGIIFKKGQIVATVEEKLLLETLKQEIHKLEETYS